MIHNYSTASDAWDARTFKVTDIVVTGHSHPHFFIVTRRSKASVWAMKLGKMVVSHDGYGQNGYVVPNLAERGREVMGRIGKGGYVRLDGETAHVWSGRPVNFYTD